MGRAKGQLLVYEISMSEIWIPDCYCGGHRCEVCHVVSSSRENMVIVLRQLLTIFNTNYVGQYAPYSKVC